MVGVDRGEELVVGEPGRCAGGLEDERGVDAEASYQPGVAGGLGPLDELGELDAGSGAGQRQLRR